jgi:hypothetical protein
MIKKRKKKRKNSILLIMKQFYIKPNQYSILIRRTNTLMEETLWVIKKEQNNVLGLTKIRYDNILMEFHQKKNT